MLHFQAIISGDLKHFRAWCWPQKHWLLWISEDYWRIAWGDNAVGEKPNWGTALVGEDYWRETEKVLKSWSIFAMEVIFVKQSVLSDATQWLIDLHWVAIERSDKARVKSIGNMPSRKPAARIETGKKSGSMIWRLSTPLHWRQMALSCKWPTWKMCAVGLKSDSAALSLWML